MGDTYRLKMKIGEHEFEAEGPSDLVNAQFAAFRELVTAVPTQAAKAEERDQTPPGRQGNNDQLALDRIMRNDGRLISLTVRDDSVDNEIMLLLLGQKTLRNNDSVTGAEILDGLRQTGRPIPRADYQLDKLSASGDVITIGTRRARRYRLTYQGLAKAQALARDLIATVA